MTMKRKGPEMTAPLLRELTLPCGAALPNRVAKAAMTEGLATMAGVPTPELDRLYGLWSDGGAGLLISGNIQVDRDHLERPGNVIIDGEPDAELEAGLVRAKNTAEILTKNVALFAIACIMYMVVGFNIMYPDAGNGVIPALNLSFMFGGDHTVESVAAQEELPEHYEPVLVEDRRLALVEAPVAGGPGGAAAR